MLDRGSLIGHSLLFLLAGFIDVMSPKRANLIPAVPPLGEDDACREWAIKYRSSFTTRVFKVGSSTRWCLWSGQSRASAIERKRPQTAMLQEIEAATARSNGRPSILRVVFAHPTAIKANLQYRGDPRTRHLESASFRLLESVPHRFERLLTP